MIRQRHRWTSRRERWSRPSSPIDEAVAGYTPEERGVAQAAVAKADAAISTLQAQVDEMTVKAPIGGQVYQISAELGEYVSPGVPLLSLIDLSDVWLRFDLREDLVKGLKVGDRFTVRIPALGDTPVTVEVRTIATRGEYAGWRATRATGDFDLRTFEVRAYPVDKIPEFEARHERLCGLGRSTLMASCPSRRHCRRRRPRGHLDLARQGGAAAGPRHSVDCLRAAGRDLQQCGDPRPQGRRRRPRPVDRHPRHLSRRSAQHPAWTSLNVRRTSTEPCTRVRAGRAIAAVYIPEILSATSSAGRRPQLVIFYNKQFFTPGNVASSGLQAAVSAALADLPAGARSASFTPGPLVVEQYVLTNPALNYVQFLLRAILPTVLHIVTAVAGGYAVGSEFSARSVGSGCPPQAAVRLRRWSASWCPIWEFSFSSWPPVS